MQSLNLSLIQTHTQWHDASANRALFDDWLTQIPANTHVVMLPEMFSTGFTMHSAEVAETMSGPTVAWMRDNAARLRSVLCGSVVIEEGGDYFNRFIWAMPDGTLSTYDKRHRFRMAGEHEHYQAGARREVFEVAGWRVCPFVCYDLRFPVWLRNRQDYDLLLCVANWPAARQSAWNTLLRARAIENQCYVAAVNIIGVDGNEVAYGGGSAAYAADGEVLVEHFDEPAMINVSLDMDRLNGLRKSFPVWQDADRFSVD